MIQTLRIMKNLPLVFVFLVVSFYAFGQNELIIKSSEKGFYLEHKVTPKENFYSIARLYNVAPKGVAAYNGLDMAKGLNIGQVIHIPLTSVNFSQTVNEGTPVYYKVGEKESLTKVSNANNKVSPDNLRRWNNLSNDNVNAGSKLIVGYITLTSQTPVVKQETPAVEDKKDVAVVNKETQTEKKEDSVINLPPGPMKKDPTAEKPETNDNRLASPKSNLTTVVMDDPKSNPGYFKSFFEQQVKVSPISKNQTVTSGIFKTASGWQDYKYYLLIDGVQPGTIIKVINPTNNKAVYAKVLGEMSGIKQNAGYDIRISNAAATALEISDTDKFIVKVNY